MLIGIVGAPNKGKSTLFSALTEASVDIADYPFTTIDPNRGTTYVTAECVEKEKSLKCRPKNSKCMNGTRYIPISVIDVAGLVGGAHEGKGRGNQFLNDIASSDVLILVADASGRTDSNGNPCSDCNPVEDVRMVRLELAEWLATSIRKGMKQIARSQNPEEALAVYLSGFKITRQHVDAALGKLNLQISKDGLPDDKILALASELMLLSKPFIIAANKADVPGSEANVEKLKSEFGAAEVVACSAAVELALRKARSKGIIKYEEGTDSFEVADGSASTEQAAALKAMSSMLKKDGGTHVQEILNRVVFGLLDSIVVYPVEDENKWSDSNGNVLPDAVLLKKGSTTMDLAMAVHTEIAKKMLYAVDGRTHARLAKNHALNNNDVIKIVSAAK